MASLESGVLVGSDWFRLVFAGLLGQISLICPPVKRPRLAELDREPLPKKIMQERWLSVEEIAAHLGVNPDTIYKWIERKSMPAHKVGRLWKFKASEVDDWVRTGTAGEPDRES